MNKNHTPMSLESRALTARLIRQWRGVPYHAERRKQLQRYMREDTAYWRKRCWRKVVSCVQGAFVAALLLALGGILFFGAAIINDLLT